ncbi:MAG TPA: MFS transporter [Nocardioidaceae bacterium]
MGRTRLITAAAFTGSLGWGAILPFQYAYVVDARHWGAAAGMLTGTLFCVGAVVAAPLAGRLADRYSAGRLAVVVSLIAAMATLAMGLAGSVTTFLAGMLVLGAAVTAAAPATQVLVLESVPAADRRSVFAYQFTSQALGMAVGAFAAGLVVEVDTPTGMWPAFAAATLGFVVTAAFLAAATRTAADLTAATRWGQEVSTGSTAGSGSTAELDGDGWRTYRFLARNRQVRLLGLLSIALAAGFYAQFETGLPAFALQSLSVEPTVVGTAAAVNCVVIVGLQWLVVRLTGSQSGAALLAVVGGIWVASWLLLEVALFVSPQVAGVMFVVTFAIFAVGETMYAPILSPLTAAVAPAGLVGTTLGALAALRTGISAVGPLVAGVLFAFDLPHVFVLGHVAINAAAIALAVRLHQAQTAPTSDVDTVAQGAPDRSGGTDAEPVPA